MEWAAEWRPSRGYTQYSAYTARDRRLVMAAIIKSFHAHYQYN